MSVMMVPDGQWAALSQRRAAAIQALNQLQKDDESPLWWNRAYPVDIQMPLFSGSTSGGGFPVAFGTLNIDYGATFYALGLEATYNCTGLLTEDSSPATLTIPETVRFLIFDYTWSIRDSATDQDWSNLVVPSQVIRTGNLGMMGIGGQRRLPGGAKVTVTINPTFFDSTSTATGLKTFSSHSLQFVLSGIAVKDGVQW